MLARCRDGAFRLSTPCFCALYSSTTAAFPAAAQLRASALATGQATGLRRPTKRRSGTAAAAAGVSMMRNRPRKKRPTYQASSITTTAGEGCGGGDSCRNKTSFLKNQQHTKRNSGGKLRQQHTHAEPKFVGESSSVSGSDRRRLGSSRLSQKFGTFSLFAVPKNESVTNPRSSRMLKKKKKVSKSKKMHHPR